MAMIATATFNKDPDSTLDYQINWTDWLNGDEISTSAWLVPAGITEASNSNTTTTTTIFIGGGTVGVRYIVRNRITTTLGRTVDRSFALQVVNR